jgi:hypothetical protein
VGRVDGRVGSPLARTRGVREVSMAGDGDGIGEADGGLMLPVVLRPAPGEGISARLGIPQVVKVPLSAPVGKDEEAQELPVNPTRGRHDTGQKGVSGARSAGPYPISEFSGTLTDLHTRTN